MIRMVVFRHSFRIRSYLAGVPLPIENPACNAVSQRKAVVADKICFNLQIYVNRATKPNLLPFTAFLALKISPFSLFLLSRVVSKKWNPQLRCCGFRMLWAYFVEMKIFSAFIVM
jgi:hypothetical protein